MRVVGGRQLLLAVVSLCWVCGWVWCGDGGGRELRKGSVELSFCLEGCEGGGTSIYAPARAVAESASSGVRGPGVGAHSESSVAHCSSPEMLAA